MNIKILSKKSAEYLLKTEFPKNTAVISFCSPPAPRLDNDICQPDYGNKAEEVFYVSIHDIDLEVLGNYGLTYETYFPEADDLAEFIKAAHDKGLDIMCQCEYGQSRSAACAAAISQYYFQNGIDIFADYRYYPNQLVYHKIYDALCKINAKNSEVK